MRRTDNVRALREDAYLTPFLPALERRARQARELAQRLTGGAQSLADFASGHEYYGLHRAAEGWVFREWAPQAEAVVLVGDFSGWEEREAFALRREGAHGDWSLALPARALAHGDLYRLRLRWPGGGGDRIPAYARRVLQDEHTKIFNAQVWSPDKPYRWRRAAAPPLRTAPLIYEAHAGMAQEHEGVGSFREFREHILPRVVRAGYNTLQLMAVMEHPYYGSFGYHVSSFFAVSSRFGTPHEFKELVDAAHDAGVRVIMDMVHSHAVRNEVEGLSRFDGTPYQYFHDGPRGYHEAWDSRCFDYGKPQVLHFLLSNCRFWLDEYRIDGFRFDGVTSMVYRDHGLGRAFNSYDRYFDDGVDEDAVAYLALANEVIHTVRPAAITVAEDVSGMPGLAVPGDQGGCGFDYRLAMGVADCWFKLANDVRDEDWDMGALWHELTNRRADERTISYVECHDQSLVGSKTMIFELIDAAMYTRMRAEDHDLTVDRGIALHKLMRLSTLATAGHGYLNFMGNEFGHPEWVDFPREGNGWSYHFARRQWSLVDNADLKYRQLAEFDLAMLATVSAQGAVGQSAPRLVALHNDDKLFAVERGDLLLVFNFHPARSHVDYPIDSGPGAWRHALDSDEARFGGRGRIAAGQRYLSHALPGGGPERRYGIRIYLPSRTALALRRDAI